MTPSSDPTRYQPPQSESLVKVNTAHDHEAHRLTAKKKYSFVRLRSEQHDHATSEWETHGQGSKSGSILETIGEIHDDELADHVDDTQGHVEEK